MTHCKTCQQEVVLVKETKYVKVWRCTSCHHVYAHTVPS